MTKLKTPSITKLPPEPVDSQILTLGAYAREIIDRQYHHMVSQERGVLADQDPEYLHQMRVGSRRLSTALQVFSHAVHIPKAGSARHVRDLTKALGTLRDLDVQIATVRENYYPHLNISERKLIDKRQRVFTKVEAVLRHTNYEKLKSAYKSWLQNPQYKSLSHLPLDLLLPDLLTPLLSALLLHPGWAIAADKASDLNEKVLHDLRKTCKYVRYQSEFFTSFYGKAFKGWVDELKELQDGLGKVHDLDVLRALLMHDLPQAKVIPELLQAMQDDCLEILVNWEPLRQKYLSHDFRLHLHQMILEPLVVL
jgi:CHAD domain-containing protein